jgi:hypothetical protein
MTFVTGTPEFLRKAETADLGRPSRIEWNEPELDRPHQLGPDDYGLPAKRPLFPAVDLDGLANAIRRDPLREIAVKTRALTYGEMMDYAAAIMGPEYKAPTTAHEFAAMLDGWTKRALASE